VRTRIAARVIGLENLTAEFRETLEGDKTVKTSMKNLGMMILIALGTVLALVAVSAASAVWGS
jgi:hypothetical protein